MRGGSDSARSWAVVFVTDGAANARHDGTRQGITRDLELLNINQIKELLNIILIKKLLNRILCQVTIPNFTTISWTYGPREAENPRHKLCHGLIHA
jgi:hypothetical protein